MALLAVHLFMAPAQRETAVFFMVKFLGKPVECHVAASAVSGLSIAGLTTGELAAVRIGVTTGAMPRRALERQIQLAFDSRRLVARRARSLGVPINQGKAGGRVIENGTPPGILVVAGHAIGLVRMRTAVAVGAGRVLWCQVCCLRIDALARCRRSQWFVTTETRRGLMGTTQR